MKKLLIPLSFLLLFSNTANADPFTQMLKGGLKGGLRNGSEGNSYEKIMFNKNIGNYGSLTTVKVIKSYDSFYGKTSCQFNKPSELRFNEYYDLVIFGTAIYNYKPKTAFKLDNNPPVVLRSMDYGGDVEKKVIPYSKWTQNKQLTLRRLQNEFKYDLKALNKALEIYKKCKRSLNN